MAELFLCVLAAIFAGYFALAGYDYGVGILLRRTARDDTERRMVLGALGPFFLGNEVWLVTGLGLFLAAFPMTEGSMLSALYPMAFPLIASIVVFTAAVQVRSRTSAARGLWDTLIVATGFINSFGWGAVFGAALQGFPVHFGPLPILTGAATTALFVLHGSVLLSLRTPIEVQERALRIAWRMGYAAVVLAAVAAAAAAVLSPVIAQPLAAAGGTIVLVAVLAAAIRLLRTGRLGWALVCTGAAAALPVVITGVALLPGPYVHADNAGMRSMVEAAAGPATLDFLAVAALPTLPLLLGVQAAT
ncbi:MAG TPA: cytochrome d ubiquinol oxidase subunit II, partial [Stackebrandtia sp.]|uniref:cytochrome d ubiquinol oxidase subunit II n=1 Tax=Stackebrandtia sp. TaxID=2023065 RepID=UPI002D378990